MTESNSGKSGTFGKAAVGVADSLEDLSPELRRQAEAALKDPTDLAPTGAPPGSLAKKEIETERKSPEVAPLTADRFPLLKGSVEDLIVIAQNDLAILIIGPTGTGKGATAEAAHALSPRAARPFKKLNCANLSTELFESEMFGYERGAFTGAITAKKGLVETAEHGTIFLDEVSELTLRSQAKLLSFLEDHKFTRVGGINERQIDVRIIAATNADLKQLVLEGKFREDLYYRLQCFEVELLSLNERPEAILPIGISVLQNIAAKKRQSPKPLTEQARQKLQSYTWPGNIREMDNRLKVAVALSDARNSPTIGANHLKIPTTVVSRDFFSSTTLVQAAESSYGHVTFSDANDTFSRALIAKALKENRTKGAAAKALGMSPRTLSYHLQKYGLDKDGSEDALKLTIET